MHSYQGILGTSRFPSDSHKQDHYVDKRQVAGSSLDMSSRVEVSNSSDNGDPMYAHPTFGVDYRFNLILGKLLENLILIGTHHLGLQTKKNL
jgi:hypothetical protein